MGCSLYCPVAGKRKPLTSWASKEQIPLIIVSTVNSRCQAEDCDHTWCPTVCVSLNPASFPFSWIKQSSVHIFPQQGLVSFAKDPLINVTAEKAEELSCKY